MNNKPVKRILSSLTGVFPVKMLMPAYGHRFIFPFWHAVSDTPPVHLSGLYSMPTAGEFSCDLDFLLKHFKSASIAEVAEQPKNARLFFPSFDDGLAECYHTIAPILKQKGVQAAFFINPEFVGNQLLFHRHKASVLLNFLNEKRPTPSEMKEAERVAGNRLKNGDIAHFLHQAVFTDHVLLDRIAQVLGLDFNEYLKQNQPYMSLSQIQELQRNGFLIGAHGMDHREFFRSSESEILEQVASSLEFVSQKINPQPKWFAFPFTDFKVPDTIFEKALQDKIWDLSFGTAGIKDETMQNHIQRIPMEGSKRQPAEKVIRAEYAWFAAKSLLGKNKVNRQ